MIENFSILIPVYNFNVVPLVEQLKTIAKKTCKPFEILIIDDKSKLEFKEKNASLKDDSVVRYLELEENIGRSKIRNLLFQKAKYESCIILDCDVLLAKENFLDLYLENLNQDNVVIGGHIYLQNAPKDKSKYFHWLYGKRIEVKPLSERLKNPYASFMTNSFAICKSLFLKIKFDESISEYGHEDTLFGFELNHKNIDIKHISNPVVHLGIENETEFMFKQEKAIENLVKLVNDSKFKEVLSKNLKLVQFYNLFYNKFPYNFLISGLKITVNTLDKFLKIDFVRLTKFNLWKLEKFDFYSKKHTKQ